MHPLAKTWLISLGIAENGLYRWECACGAVVRDYDGRIACENGLNQHYRDDAHPR